MNQSELRSVLDNVRAVYGIPEWDLYWEDQALFEDFQEQIERLCHAAAFTIEEATSKQLFLGRVQEQYQKMLQGYGNDGWFDAFCTAGNELFKILHDRLSTDQPWMLDALSRSAEFMAKIDESTNFAQLSPEVVIHFAPTFQFIALLDLLSSDQEEEEEAA